jgi:hypothetical protein
LDILVLLAERNPPVEFISEMHSCLLSYAQAFERFIPFKVEMDLGDYELCPFDFSPAYWPYFRRCLINAFKKNYTHLVDASLIRAKLATLTEDGLNLRTKDPRFSNT